METQLPPLSLGLLQVLTRIAADLDELACSPLPSTVAAVEGKEDLRARHRQRLTEPEPKPQRLSAQEERAALREALRLPRFTGR